MKLRSTEVIIIETEAFYRLVDEVKMAVKTAVSEAHRQVMVENNPAVDWIKKDVAMKLLGIKSKTKLQELRDNGEIVFSQKPGGKIILYSRKSIIKYLEKNQHKSF